MILLKLYLTFVKIGMLSIGGGYVVIPLIQTEIVENLQWISLKELADLITIAEMTPGPIAINSATFVGYRVGGPIGSCIATLGSVTPSLFIVSILAHFYFKYRKMSYMQGVLSVMRAIVVVLIAQAAFRISCLAVFKSGHFDISRTDYLSLGSFAGALILLGHFKINPILAMLLCGAIRLGFFVFFNIS